MQGSGPSQRVYKYTHVEYLFISNNSLVGIGWIYKLQRDSQCLFGFPHYRANYDKNIHLPLLEAIKQSNPYINHSHTSEIQLNCKHSHKQHKLNTYYVIVRSMPSLCSMYWQVQRSFQPSSIGIQTKIIMFSSDFCFHSL